MLRLNTRPLVSFERGTGVYCRTDRDVEGGDGESGDRGDEEADEEGEEGEEGERIQMLPRNRRHTWRG